MRLQQKCPLCHKPLVLLNECSIGDEVLKSYKCGHAFADSAIAVDENALCFKSVDGSKEARTYQKEGIEFILKSDFNCIIGDQMRLGKTPQSLLALRNAFEERTPALILVRAANLWQWVREFKTWTSSLPNGIWPISGTKSIIPPGFSAYIVSMDTFSRPGMMERLLDFGFKLCIVDEAHSFKNSDSKRSQALIAFLKQINRADLVHEIPFNCPICREQWTETVTVRIDSASATQQTTKRSSCPKCGASITQSAAAHVSVKRNCGCVLLTGTPIKNRADEYFVPLNIVAPDKVPSLASFRSRYLTQDSNGKWNRISPYAKQAFDDLTRPYVLRREKEDVYKDLPKLNRMFTVIEISDERLKKAYNKVLDKMESELDNGERSFKFFDSIGDLMILRQICGIAKVPFCADYVESSLDGNRAIKMAIGVHHHSVRDSVMYSLAQYGCIKLDGETNPEEKDRLAHKYFQTAPEQVMCLGMPAAKEGLELVYIDNAIVLEREWSSAEEDQFEYRFYNPDKDLLESKGISRDKVTNIEYIVAKGTIDEWFYDMVEEKRRIFGETLSSNWDITADAGSFKALVEKTISHRL